MTIGIRVVVVATVDGGVCIALRVLLWVARFLIIASFVLILIVGATLVAVSILILTVGGTRSNMILGVMLVRFTRVRLGMRMLRRRRLLLRQVFRVGHQLAIRLTLRSGL